MSNSTAVGMQCPSCRIDLHLTERQGIEVDYCPRCRGVWLDRGELDKIVERGSESPPLYAGNLGPRHGASHENRRGLDDDDYDDRYSHRKKRGFLGDLFDFD